MRLETFEGVVYADFFKATKQHQKPETSPQHLAMTRSLSMKGNLIYDGKIFCKNGINNWSLRR
jgi:hypothetical protein